MVTLEFLTFDSHFQGLNPATDFVGFSVRGVPKSSGVQVCIQLLKTSSRFALLTETELLEKKLNCRFATFHVETAVRRKMTIEPIEFERLLNHLSDDCFKANIGK